MWKPIVLLAAVASVVAFDEVPFDDEPTLLDALYGQLMDGEPRVAPSSDFGIASHHLRYQQGLNLPSDDDISDIDVDQTFFGGILTYAHFRHVNCVKPDGDDPIDIAILGAPFDTAVSYRPGARFGPEAIRSNARRFGGINGGKAGQAGSHRGPEVPYDPTTHNYSIIDCGDVPMTPFDNRVALNQLYRTQRAIHNRTGDNFAVPKIITMGGDHTVALMALRSVYEHHGPVHVVHFDSHIDTWDPKMLGGGITDYMKLNHGTFLHYAHEKGYLADKNFHVGIRAPMIDEVFDRDHDKHCGFEIITASAIDEIGVKGMLEKVKRGIPAGAAVYISVDIDVLDPAFAPGTGTMESGGFTSRELLTLLRGLKGLNVVGADVVEVSPPYDTNSEITALSATFVIDELLKLMIKK
ncbi:guanidinobutyrase [Diutina catenulata]